MEKQKQFEHFCSVIETLRSENGCPWDREQTHNSLVSGLLEECYEVIDAIQKNDMNALCEELGDVLLHIVMQSYIAQEEGCFNISDVIQGIDNKMVYRHPHVFSDKNSSNTQEVLDNWDRLKQQEKNYASQTDKLQKIPPSLPGLMRGEKIQKTASKTFPIPYDASEAIDQTIEQLNQLKKTMDTDSSIRKKNLEVELGAILFKIITISRLLEINTEFALTNTLETFINRFEIVENRLFSAVAASRQKSPAHQGDPLWQ